MAKIEIPKPKLQGFVIYNPANEKFSRGGSYPKWSDKPKIWSNIGHLKNHLTVALIIGPRWENGKPAPIYAISKRYEGCLIYNIVTDEVVDFDFYKYVEAKAAENYYVKQKGYKIQHV